MMTNCGPGQITEVSCTSMGEAVTVWTEQPQGDPGGWWIYLYAIMPRGGPQYAKVVVLTLPFRDLSRVVARHVVPGALTWKASVQAPAGVTSGIRVGLAACEYPWSEYEPTGKGWGYDTAAAPGTSVVPLGARVQEVSMVSGPAGGTVQFTMWRDATRTEVLGSIVVPPSTSYTHPAAALAGAHIQSVAFGGDVVASEVDWIE